jgi:hypothetical protein
MGDKAETEREVAIVGSEEMAPAALCQLVVHARAQRALTGLVPIVVPAEVLTHLCWENAQNLRASRAAYEAATNGWTALPGESEPIARSLEKALDRLGQRTGRDPVSILHRLPVDLLAGLEDQAGGEPLAEEDLLPDSVEEAYSAALRERAEMRAERAEMLADGRQPGLLILDSPRRAPDERAAIDELVCEAGRVLLLATTPARALLELGFGGFNQCPAPETQARIWEHWAQSLGAEPLVIGSDWIGGTIARPVQTRGELVQLASEVIRYDGDSLIEGPLFLLGQLFRNAMLSCWWD